VFARGEGQWKRIVVLRMVQVQVRSGASSSTVLAGLPA
jgi:hypothetical protein